jgi:very-short-patch-repair endonuclease
MQKEYDKNRETEIANLNIIFLRFLNKDIFDDLNSVTDKIRNEIETVRISNLSAK